MPRSWFDFQIFIRVSNRIFLEFLFEFQVVQASNRLTIEGPLYVYTWIPFMDPENIKILSQGPSGTLVKEQGSPELILDYGAQRARLCRCIGTVRSRTQC